MLSSPSSLPKTAKKSKHTLVVIGKFGMHINTAKIKDKNLKLLN